MGMFGQGLKTFFLGTDEMHRREQEAQQQAWMRAVLGGIVPQQGAPPPPVKASDGADISDAFGPQAGSAPKAKSYQDLLPLLSMGALRGYKGAGDVASMLQAADKPPPSMEGPDGIYERGRDGWSRPVAYPDKPPAIPFGWEMGPDGNPRPKKGGPADPAYIAQTAGVRRDAIVSRPAPSRARAASHKPNEIKWD